MKPLVVFYNKVCALVAALGDLVDIQTLTDTAVLQVMFLVVLHSSFPFGHFSWVDLALNRSWQV